MKEPEFAYCGLDCNKCPILIATASNDNLLREETAKAWSDLYSNILSDMGIGNLKPEDINCNGCRSTSCLFAASANCPIRKCCQEKGFITCASCNEYELCDYLKGFYSLTIHQPAKDNLDRIRMS